MVDFNLQMTPHLPGETHSSYFPVLANSTLKTAEQLCEIVQERCTVTATDIVAVMNAIASVVVEELSKGGRVELPQLGYLSPMLSCDYKITYVNDKRIGRHLHLSGIRFKPKVSIVNKITCTCFRRVQTGVCNFISLSDEEILSRVALFVKQHPYEILNRSYFEKITGYKRVRSIYTLNRLVREGKLVRAGLRTAPYYILPEVATAKQNQFTHSWNVEGGENV